MPAEQPSAADVLPAARRSAALDVRRLPAGAPVSRARRMSRPRLRCPVCDGAPRLPADLREPVRCQCGALLRVALVPARRPLAVTNDWDEAPAAKAPAAPAASLW